MSKIKKISIYISAVTLIFSVIYISLLCLYYSSRYIIPKDISVPLNSTLTYKEGYIYDNNNDVIIDTYITELKIYKNFVYGKRDIGLASDKYTYFICNYDEAKKDCDNNYNLEEFNKLLLDKNLPEFNYTKNSNDLIFMEWIKRKISFQKTPPSPFWEDPEQNTEKILEPIKYFATLILFTFSVFTYSTPYILIALILLLFVFGYLFIKKRQKHKNNN